MKCTWRYCFREGSKGCNLYRQTFKDLHCINEFLAPHLKANFLHLFPTGSCSQIQNARKLSKACIYAKPSRSLYLAKIRNVFISAAKTEALSHASTKLQNASEWIENRMMMTIMALEKREVYHHAVVICIFCGTLYQLHWGTRDGETFRFLLNMLKAREPKTFDLVWIKASLWFCDEKPQNLVSLSCCICLSWWDLVEKNLCNYFENFCRSKGR